MNTHFARLFLFLFAWSNVLQVVHCSKTVVKFLEISRGSASPDCAQRDGLLLVNGSFTGPEIRVTEGDSLELTILNKLNESISIHLHGIFQLGSNEMDGASFISTKPISPNQSTLIKTTITKQSGTFLYHAHLGLLDLHVYGPLIVESVTIDEKSRLGYEEERTLTLSDYWRADPDQLLDGLVNTEKFQFVGSPQSFLTNGKTNGGNCSASFTPSASAYHITSIDAGKTYRFRLIGATSLFAVHFSIPNHKMTLVEVEGTLIKPISVDYVELLPGQRYSVLVKADQVPGQYWMQQVGKWRSGAPINGFSILKYNSFPAALSPTPPSLSPSANETFGWINSKFQPLDSSLEETMPAKADKVLVLEGTQIAWTPSTKRRWTVNNISYVFPQGDTVRDHALAGTLADLPLESRPIAVFKKDQVVDFIFQNTVALNGACETHPWHMHGHSFWHLDSGAGNFSASFSLTDTQAAFTSPILRDTVSLYPSNNSNTQPPGVAGSACGWSRIRVVMSNPGTWALHCHIASHFAMGMGTAFVVESDSAPVVDLNSISNHTKRDEQYILLSSASAPFFMNTFAYAVFFMLINFW